MSGRSVLAWCVRHDLQEATFFEDQPPGLNRLRELAAQLDSPLLRARKAAAPPGRRPRKGKAAASA